MDDLNLTAEELRDFRRVLGWSQQKLADELDVARNTVVRMENGQMAIERRTALAVRYLACTTTRSRRSRTGKRCSSPVSRCRKPRSNELGQCMPLICVKRKVGKVCISVYLKWCYMMLRFMIR